MEDNKDYDFLDLLEDVRDAEEYHPAYDDVKIEKDKEDLMWEEFFAEDKEETTVNECGEITTISDLGKICYEEWMNPKYNIAFTEWDKNKIILKDDNKKIGVKLDIVSFADYSNRYELTIWGNSIGEAMSKYQVFINFLLDYIDDTPYVIKPQVNKVQELRKYFLNKVLDKKRRDLLESKHSKYANDFKTILNSKKDFKLIIKDTEKLIDGLKILCP